jgi:hypothetical protein
MSEPARQLADSDYRQNASGSCSVRGSCQQYRPIWVSNSILPILKDLLPSGRADGWHLMPEQADIPLSNIDIDPRAWPRQALNEERVREFAVIYGDSGPYALDPVEVIRRGDRFLLANGRHRYAARRMIGAVDVPTVILPLQGSDPVQLAYEYALADSARSSLPLTRAEKHAAVVRLVREQPDRTDVAIASLVGVSSKTVQRVRQWLVQNPEPAAAEPPQRPAPLPPTAEKVAQQLVRQLGRLWEARSPLQALGLRDTGRLGDLLAEAFIAEVGPKDATVWTQRFCTWATRAHSVAVAAASEVEE